MTRKAKEYADRLRGADDWIGFLRQHAGLPGPRANLELIQAVAEAAAPDFILKLVASDDGAEGTPDEYLVCCGIVGLGRLVSDGDASHLSVLRQFASARRWRVREAVAMALQRIGDVDVDQLLSIAATWSRGTCLEQRAAAAAICEPRLLRDGRHAHPCSPS